MIKGKMFSKNNFFMFVDFVCENVCYHYWSSIAESQACIGFAAN
jgi:hypothetical protein